MKNCKVIYIRNKALLEQFFTYSIVDALKFLRLLNFLIRLYQDTKFILLPDTAKNPEPKFICCILLNILFI